MAKNRRDRDGGGFGTDGLVAVAIDRDKNSQAALKWAVDNLLQKGQTVVLLHVKPRASSLSTSPSINSNSASKNLFFYFFSVSGSFCFFYVSSFLSR